MAKNIQLREDVYDKLTSFMRPKETYSEVVGRILILLDKVGELRTILEGQIAFRNHQKEQLEKKAHP